MLGWARRIVADAEAMRQDLRAARRGLAGSLRIAVIPTALAAVARLTAPFLARHPEVSVTVLSRSSDEVLRMLADLEVDAGLTYLDNEPLGRARTVPLYAERYRLVTAAGGALGARDAGDWAEVGRERLCLLTPDMQNRRIVDEHLRRAGHAPGSDAGIGFHHRAPGPRAGRGMVGRDGGAAARRARPARRRPRRADQRPAGPASRWGSRSRRASPARRSAAALLAEAQALARDAGGPGGPAV